MIFDQHTEVYRLFKFSSAQPSQASTKGNEDFERENKTPCIVVNLSRTDRHLDNIILSKYITIKGNKRENRDKNRLIQVYQYENIMRLQNTFV